MSDIRTTRFGNVDLTDTAIHTAYTVPAGKRALVRSFTVLNARGAAANCYCGVTSSGGAPRMLTGHPVATLDGLAMDPWLVADAGEMLVVQATTGGAGTVYAALAGVLFDL